MTPTALASWMARLGLNKAEASSRLGIARSTLDRYLDGVYNIPRVVELACRALENGLAD